MKNILVIIIFINFIFAYSQNENTEDNYKQIPLEYSLIAERCLNVTNWNEKMKCSMRVVKGIITDEFNNEIFQQLKTGNYKIWFIFSFDKPNEKVNITIECKNEILKKEAQRIITTKEFVVNLLDENGQTVKGKYKVPIGIGIE